ncbi:MAG: ABC transporter ATP-binding protein, partial [Deltaproteobacteria bacterium]|nr:ABC transporter ATP-binding protein [Deltaproteobacteria bacterium]
EVKRLIGVVPETSNLYPELTSIENLVFAGRLYGMKTSEARSKAEELLRVFDLEDKRNIPFGSLSGGMKRRLTVAASLIHDPPVLFLDEPTTGLDVMSARGLREIIQSLKGRGTTVLLTTHYIDEADRLCDRVGIIVKGKIIVIDTPDGLKKSVKAKKAIDIKIAPRPEVEDRLKFLTNVYEIERKEHFYRFYISDMKSFLAEFSDFARNNGLEIESIDTVAPSLEDAFVEITGLHREIMIEEKHAH